MRLAKGGCFHRGRVPNVTVESYTEGRKLSVPRAQAARTALHPARLEAALASPQRARTKGVRRQPAPPLESYRSPGRDQQEQLRVQRAWRPHSLRRSEHEPKECAGSLLRRGRVPHVAFEWPLFAVGKRARPGKALKHLQGTVFSAEALSRPARPAFLLPFCCRRTPLVGSRCGQRSASSLPFCCRRTPLVSFLFLSAAGASAGSEAFVAGRSLWTFSAESYAQQVFEHSRPAQRAVGVVVSHRLSMREGLGSIPGLSMCACVCHSLPLPSLSSLWVCCASCQDRLVRRGRVPNVTFKSYIESRKLSVPRARPARTALRPARLEAALASPQRARTKGVRRQPAPPLESYRSPGPRDQQEQLRVQRAWRPHSFRRSESTNPFWSAPAACSAAAGCLAASRLVASFRCGQTSAAWKSAQAAAGHSFQPAGTPLPNVTFESYIESRKLPVRPRTASRPAFLLPAHSFGWFSLWAKEQLRLVFLSAAGALLWFLSFSSRAAGASAGSEAFVAGSAPLWMLQLLKGYAQQVFEHSRPLPLDSAESYAQQVFEHSRSGQLV